MTELQPLRSILYEATGTGSFARTASLLIVVFTLAWLSYSVYKNGGVNKLDFANPLIFMVSGVTSLYGMNRATVKLQPPVEAKKEAGSV
jgi:hypothetical protein